MEFQEHVLKSGLNGLIVVSFSGNEIGTYFLICFFLQSDNWFTLEMNHCCKPAGCNWKWLKVLGLVIKKLGMTQLLFKQPWWHQLYPYRLCLSIQHQNPVNKKKQGSKYIIFRHNQLPNKLQHTVQFVKPSWKKQNFLSKKNITLWTIPLFVPLVITPIHQQTSLEEREGKKVTSLLSEHCQDLLKDGMV